MDKGILTRVLRRCLPPLVASQSESPTWARAAALGLAATRVAFGAAALALPTPAGRLWIGSGADGADHAVLLRALGGRDLALGAGVLLADRRGGPLGQWVGLGALSDLVDTAATIGGFVALPRRTRWLVLAGCGGAATAGALAARALSATS